MPIYSKQSLELLRQRIDLVEVLSSHLDLKRSGAAYKSLCPFHEEKTPSFMIQKGDRHYHCFGCGAHGDAIQFLMGYLHLSFSEAVEHLAQKFNVTLEVLDKEEEPGEISKAQLKDAIEIASHFYHFWLLNSEEGREPREYLQKRHISENFIRYFGIGFAPKDSLIFRQFMQSKKIAEGVLKEAGLLTEKGKPFFQQRILFPIRNATSQVIGFSGRKFREETFGGKYVNTAETPIFKKSHILFGLNYCRKRIAKERKAIVVEGQLDCLRLIEAGLNITVAGQGTAFGDYQVKELINLGVREVYLIFDPDLAGQTAASKVGQLFQKVGVDVYVVNLPDGEDPDSFVIKYGIQELIAKIGLGMDYLNFQIKFLSQSINVETPAGKTELANLLTKQIRDWDQPIMIHETLRKLSNILQIPQEILGIGNEFIPQLYLKRASPIELKSVDPNRILELDLLRWLILMGDETPDFIELVKKYLKSEHFWIPICRKLFLEYLVAYEHKQPKDLLSLMIAVDEKEGQGCVDEILHKKINREKAPQHLRETIQKMLDRQWMQAREEIRMKIHSGACSDDEVLELVKQFDELKKQAPKVI